MMKKIVVAVDSFKDCLSSADAGAAICKGIHRALPNVETFCVPLSDGGEGMTSVLCTAGGGSIVACSSHDPLMRSIIADYGLSADKETAYIEMASASGLALLPSDERNPAVTTSFGTGELIADAISHGCRHFIIGLGGSATCDGGLGMMQALGCRFLDSAAKQVNVTGGTLSEIQSIDMSGLMPELRECQFSVACDVAAPFCGEKGAALVFAPQKGADKNMVDKLEEGMINVANVIYRETGCDVYNFPGAGAAGGMGGALIAFMNAELKSGVELVIEHTHLIELLRYADFVITGEGRSDSQTLMGKMPLGVLRSAKLFSKPVVLLSGAVNNQEALNTAGFDAVFSIQQRPVSLNEAIEQSYAKECLCLTAEQICRLINLDEKYK